MAAYKNLKLKGPYTRSFRIQSTSSLHFLNSEIKKVKKEQFAIRRNQEKNVKGGASEQKLEMGREK